MSWTLAYHTVQLRDSLTEPHTLNAADADMVCNAFYSQAVSRDPGFCLIENELTTRMLDSARQGEHRSLARGFDHQKGEEEIW